ncbi:MAG: tetratricopeptide repeat protein [Victivallaceae bacterium]|nr:tetratricopeptide repeat protein [Victivallaceae bacterium]
MTSLAYRNGRRPQAIVLLSILSIVVFLTVLLTYCYNPHEESSDDRFQKRLIRQKMFARVYAALGENDLEKASALIDSILVGTPDDYAGWMLRAVVFYRSGEFQKAATVFTQLIGKGPDDATNYNNLGQSLVKLGEYRRAIVAFRRSLRIAPENVLVQFNLAAALAHSGDRESAIELLREINDKYGGNLLPLLEDPVLDCLRNEKSFQEILHTALIQEENRKKKESLK